MSTTWSTGKGARLVGIGVQVRNRQEILLVVVFGLIIVNGFLSLMLVGTSVFPPCEFAFVGLYGLLAAAWTMYVSYALLRRYPSGEVDPKDMHYRLTTLYTSTLTICSLAMSLLFLWLGLNVLSKVGLGVIAYLLVGVAYLIVLAILFVLRDQLLSFEIEGQPNIWLLRLVLASYSSNTPEYQRMRRLGIVWCLIAAGLGVVLGQILSYDIEIVTAGIVSLFLAFILTPRWVQSLFMWLLLFRQRGALATQNRPCSSTDQR